MLPGFVQLFQRRTVAAPRAALIALLIGLQGPAHAQGAADTSSTPVAEVDGQPITFADWQLEFTSPFTLPGVQAETTKDAALQRLIDQRLLAQRAIALGLDRDPEVLAAVRSATNRALARIYLRTVAYAQRPTAADVSRYYKEHPNLFRERKIYNLKELVITAPDGQIPDLRKRLEAAKSIEAFAESLRRSGTVFKANQAVRAAEQLPLKSVDQFAAMKAGSSIVSKIDGGINVVYVESFRREPVDEAKAAAAIEAFLFNDAMRAASTSQTEALRKDANIRVLVDLKP